MAEVRRRQPRSGDDDAFTELKPLLGRIYRNRGLSSPSDVDYRADNLLRPNFRDLAAATAMLADAVENRQRVLIVGDFDADGATGVALGMRVLGQLGTPVEYLVPDRFRFGYGLTPEIVHLALERDPWLLVTVDNGVSSIDGVAAARAAGVRVLVTDHHLPGDHLPDANALVNPNRAGCPFPSKHIAGVGVMFYVLAALRSTLKARGWFARSGTPVPHLGESLDLVALGTVADVVTLDRNNRTMVQLGLERIRRGAGCYGIGALAQVAGLELTELTSADIGFNIAPRLNAAGRLDDMSVGIECLLASDFDQALSLATTLDGLNRERRVIEDGMREQAEQTMAGIVVGDGDPPAGISLFHPDWHAGVVGILAARIRECHHRPSIAFARDGAGALKGSGRSIAEIHLRDALASIASRNPGLLGHFGGHAAAAGLTIAEADLAVFSAKFSDEIARRLEGKEPVDVVWSDGELAPGEITLENAELIRHAGPWGAGFAEPVFDGEFQIVDSRTVGGRHLKMRLRQKGGGDPIEAIRFRAEEDVENITNRGHFAYRLQVNDYRGRRSAQLVVDHIRWL